MKRFLFLAALALSLTAGDAPLDRATLRGLTAVGVVIDNLDPELTRIGLTKDSLAARIQQRLEHAGIPVKNGAPEFLGLRMIQVHDRKGPYGLCISTGLYQPVVLGRDNKVKTAAPTWDVETVVVADGKTVQDAAMSSVDELVDGFVAAWNAVNPK